MSDNKITETGEKIEKGVIEGYKKIEKGVISGYKAIEHGVVEGYKKVEEGAVNGFNKVSDKFIEKLFTREGESVEEAKERLSHGTADNDKKDGGDQA